MCFFTRPESTTSELWTLVTSANLMSLSFAAAPIPSVKRSLPDHLDFRVQNGVPTDQSCHWSNGDAACPTGDRTPSSNKGPVRTEDLGFSEREEPDADRCRR